MEIYFFMEKIQGISWKIFSQGRNSGNFHGIFFYTEKIQGIFREIFFSWNVVFSMNSGKFSMQKKTQVPAKIRGISGSK